MEEEKGNIREVYEDWKDLLGRLDALSSTVRAVHHAMECEKVSPHILDTYITINDAITGIMQFANKRVISTAYKAREEQEKQEQATLASSHG